MLRVLLTLGMSAALLPVSAQLVNNGELHIAEGAIMTVGMETINKGKIENNGKMRFKSHLRSDGSFISTGKVGLGGEKPIRVSGLSALNVDNVSIDGDVHLENSLIVNKQVDFSEGVLFTDRNSILEFKPNATYAGASDFSHVVGNVRKEGEGSFVFPLGDGFSKKDFRVNELGGRVIDASYHAASPLDVSSTLDQSVESVNSEEYWTVRTDSRNRVGVSLENNEVVSLESGVWKEGKNGVVSTFTSGKTKTIEKSIGVWPNPTSGEFNLKLTGMNDGDDITVDVTNQDGSIIQTMKGKVKDLRKAYTLPSSLATTSLKIRVINGEEVLTQTLILNK